MPIMIDWKGSIESMMEPHRLVVYFVAIVFLVGFLIRSPEEECSISLTEDRWRTVSTAIVVPLWLEYIIDDIACRLSLAERTSSHSDDPGSHWLIIASLLPTSYIPIWILGPLDLQTRAVLTNIGLVGTVHGLSRRLRSLNTDILPTNKYLIVASLFILSEILITYELPWLSLLVKATNLMFLFTCRGIQQCVLTPTSSSFFIDRRYVNVIILGSLILFLIWDLFFLLLTDISNSGLQVFVFQPSMMIKRQDMDLTTTTALFSSNYVCHRIFAQVIVVVVSAILPGRATRRGILALEETNAIMVRGMTPPFYDRYV